MNWNNWNGLDIDLTVVLTLGTKIYTDNNVSKIPECDVAHCIFAFLNS